MVEAKWLEPLAIGSHFMMVVLCGFLLMIGKLHDIETGWVKQGKMENTIWKGW
jgi:hypothetical protein